MEIDVTTETIRHAAGQLVERQPKLKRQPTAEQYREQLALAADEIIRLRTLIEGSRFAVFEVPYKHVGSTKWWRRLFSRGD